MIFSLCTCRLAWNFDFSEYGLNSSKWEILFDTMSCDGDDFNLEECKVNVNEFVLPGDFPKDDDGYYDFDYLTSYLSIISISISKFFEFF